MAIQSIRPERLHFRLHFCVAMLTGMRSIFSIWFELAAVINGLTESLLVNLSLKSLNVDSIN